MTTPTAPEAGQVIGTVFDEASVELARTYSTALLDAAGADAEAVLDELEEIVSDVLVAQPKFAELLASPAVPMVEKDRVLVDVFGGRALPVVSNFLRVLNRHGRLGVLAAITTQARVDWDRKQGRRRVTVRSAVPLDDGQRAALQGKLSALIGGATPQVKLEVDPSLIAGLVVQVGDDVYDASVRTRLKRLRDRLLERKSL
jgi:F-type H+-transporting ATPase subunit delta